MLTKLKGMVLSGDAERIGDEVKYLIKNGVDPNQIITDGLKSGMEAVGVLWHKGDMFIPEVISSANAVQAAMDTIKPVIDANSVSKCGKVAIGTVEGDIHSIGKNLVKLMLEGAQFEVIDLGVNVSAQTFAQVVERESIDILGLSSLLSTTMPRIKDVLEVLVQGGIRKKVKVIIGGAPVTRDFADIVGADGYASDAGAAVQLCLQFMKQ